jgi:hypothetical protein
MSIDTNKQIAFSHTPNRVYLGRCGIAAKSLHHNQLRAKQARQPLVDLIPHRGQINEG